ncbi:hypothetical protein CDAR_541691 [Caerostris darwini]|uniref:Uncharacterized protein n=1 Tax=Caerostris darwini TaxID=1538125 RepID=A0AAV4UVG5_9ARAC|nr:hypothetical protein CDAR_541691 [Caerostris darwini]
MYQPQNELLPGVLNTSKYTTLLRHPTSSTSWANKPELYAPPFEKEGVKHIPLLGLHENNEVYGKQLFFTVSGTTVENFFFGGEFRDCLSLVFQGCKRRQARTGPLKDDGPLDYYVALRCDGNL